MNIIDAHTHFYPNMDSDNCEIFAAVRDEKYWGKLVGKRSDGKLSLQGFPDEAKFLFDMDVAGVTRAIIQGWYWENSSTCEEMNDTISKVIARHPSRLSAFASIQISDIKSAQKIILSAREMGFIGIGEVHDAVQNFSFDDKNFEEVAKLLEFEKLPLCIHITEKSLRDYPGKVETNTQKALDAARRFPNVNFIFAHWMGGEIFNSPSEKTYPPNVYFDSAASPLLYDKKSFSDAVKHYPGAALYGSDYPLRLYPRKFKKEEMITIADEAKTSVPEDAAEKFFNTNISNAVGKII